MGDSSKGLELILGILRANNVQSATLHPDGTLSGVVFQYASQMEPYQAGVPVIDLGDTDRPTSPSNPDPFELAAKELAKR